ncbi:MAG TPA: hypothetical protein VGM52_17425 [Herbaspirillum sp.]
MNRFAIPALILSAAVLLSSAAQAMEFQQFDHMTLQDRQAFLNFLSQAAETVLNQEGRSADAQKVDTLFNEIRPGDNLPVGEAELELNVDNARVADAKRGNQNPNLPRLQVEAALAVTLKKNGIEMSADSLKGFAQVIDTFRPKSPPQ